ncbi:unnamed protein product [Cylicostephanus goldi]|uniref:Uncharacterized protein n=1 Tax=Cylicostephanus goldi TaxID=71465 RepID=A0A3P7QWH3_CYLGO|nr:unnamed protein product [Cylicostephanus goldi]
MVISCSHARVISARAMKRCIDGNAHIPFPLATITQSNFDSDNAQIIEVLASSAITTASAQLEVEHLRKELAEERRMQKERDLSRSLAIETCNEVMLSSIEHLNELQAPPDTKSVGVDTKAFTRRLRNLDLLTVGEHQ